MLLLSVNSNCVVLFCVLSIHLPLVLLFPLWQFCYWYEIPIITLSFSFYKKILPTLCICFFPLCYVRFFQTLCLSFYKSDKINLLIKLPQRISMF